MTYQEGFWSVTRRSLVLFILIVFFNHWPIASVADQSTLLFQEILPRPASNSSEYLIIYNPTTATINLKGWLIADKAKRDKPITLPDYQLAADQFWQVEAKTLGLSLNNDNEELFLWQPTGQLADTLNYIKAPLGIAYQRTSGGWRWANQLMEPELTVNPNLSDLQTTTAITPSTTTNQIIQGIITALPHQLSSQYLYITYPDNSAGLKIYCYYKLWPQLTLGNLVEITGQIVSTTQEIKLNIKNQQDIKVLATTTQLVTKIITTQDLANLNNGQLITITAKLAAKNQTTLYFTDDFGELLVQLKTSTGLKNSDFTIGQIYRLTGLMINNNGLRLVPRQPEDILKININNSSTMPTTLDFTISKKSTISPLIWIIGLTIGFTTAFLAYKLIKK